MILPPICHHCDEPIEPPDEPVFVGAELKNSAGAWTIWAHPEHVELLRPDPIPTNLLARVLMARLSDGDERRDT